MSTPLKIFLIYAREDEIFKNGLLAAFIPLRRTGKIDILIPKMLMLITTEE